jgi:hypothetical protein
MLPDYIESIREGTFLSGMLAGFAIAIVIELISRGKKGRLASFVIGTFLLASAILVATTVCGVLMVALSRSPAGLPQAPSAEMLICIGVSVGNLTFLGLIAFLAGIGMVGWTYSKPIGIFSTITSMLSLLYVIWVTLRLAGLGA